MDAASFKPLFQIVMSVIWFRYRVNGARFGIAHARWLQPE
jgi:hypothetical protein